MNLLHEEVTHKVFGEGEIVAQDESTITINFNQDTKKFVFPDAFGKFITLKNRETAKTLKELIEKREMERAKLEKQREEERERKELEQQLKEKLKNAKIHESSQMVFWLDEEEQKTVFTDWQVFIGKIQSGKNKGRPNRPARLRPNSALVLTRREPDEPETERKIIGLYMVTETFTGHRCDDGIVPAHSQFRIKLTDEEGEKMLFWNYYVNKNYPHRMTWNSGKYRYFDNIWTAQILKDIIQIKKEKEEIEAAEQFLEYFCQMNALNRDEIPEANGALKQQS